MQSDFAAARLACSYFFLIPGLAYGLLTARMPALMAATGAGESAVGAALLASGLGALLSLAAGPRILARTDLRALLAAASAGMLAGLCAAGLAGSVAMLVACSAFIGLSMGLGDMAMNVAAVGIEQKFCRACMAGFHATYSIGGLAGSLLASAAAGLGIPVFVNFAAITLATLAPIPCALRSLPEPAPAQAQSQRHGAGRLPAVVLLIGLMGALAYCAEGSVAEWGAILLARCKGAPESVAALVFAFLCVPMALCRLLADAIRTRLGNTPLLVGGGLLSAAAMAMVLAADSPWVSLAGYALVGVGLSSIVPILFSITGSLQGVDAARACSAVSLASYGGMLTVPPLLGNLAEAFTLPHALALIPAFCTAIAVLALPMLRMARRPAG